MAPEDKALPHQPDSQNASGWVGVVPVSEDTVERLPVFFSTLKQNSLLKDFHVYFVADDAMGKRINTQLGDANAAWSVISAGRGANQVSAIADVARLHDGRDVALLAPEAVLPFAWDARLRKAAYAEPNIAVAMPLCDVDPMFALLEGPLPPGTTLDPVLIDRTAYSMGNRNYYEVPQAHVICAFFRRDSLDLLTGHGVKKLRELTTVAELVKQLRARGKICVLCDFVYVGISSPFDTVLPTSDIEALAFRRHHPLGSLRRSVGEAIKTGIASVSVPGLDDRPVQLHIMHFWGGGLDKWVRDFGGADASRTNLVFSSFRIGETGGQRLVLYSDPVDPNPIRVWDIAQPIRSTLSTNIEYRNVLEQIVREFEVEAIIISSLIGHTLDALNQAAKTLVVCHDYYPVCQAINPQFGKTCERCTLDDLGICAKTNPLNSIFVDQSSDEWHAMRSLYVERLLANKIELVVPSPSVEKTLKRLSPRMDDLKFHLIPHGIDMNAESLPVATRKVHEPLRLVVLGRLSIHKGSELLRAACDALRPLAQITLVGCGGNGVKLAKTCNWQYIEKYEPADLPAILRRIAPHAAVLASVIPETFSYTLSELNLLGVPALATALGSFNDRIVDRESGFLFQPVPASLITLVQELHDDPELLTKIANKLRSTSQHRNVADMAYDYRALIPSAPRPIARFRVGVGIQSGLTEPYRHLSEAYVQITGAYEDTRLAYGATQAALTAAAADQEKLSKMTGESDQFLADVDALNPRKRWWRVFRTLDLIDAFREKLRNLKNVEVVNQPETTENSPQ